MEKHFTATAYIVAKFGNNYKLLLHKHKKHKLWIGIGGHIEVNENPVEALIREVKEETNLDVDLLKNSRLFKTDDIEELAIPDAILQEKLPAYRNESAHFHIDLIYFTFCKNPKRIKMKEEFNWFSKKDLKGKNLGKEVKYLANKVFKIPFKF